jgi:hypothetical protein
LSSLAVCRVHGVWVVPENLCLQGALSDVQMGKTGGQWCKVFLTVPGAQSVGIQKVGASYQCGCEWV